MGLSLESSIPSFAVSLVPGGRIGFRQKIIGQIFPFPFWSKEVVRSQESEVACGKELSEANGAVAPF